MVLECNRTKTDYKVKDRIRNRHVNEVKMFCYIASKITSTCESNKAIKRKLHKQGKLYYKDLLTSI